MHRAFLFFLLCHNSRVWIFSRAPQSQLIAQSPFLYCPSGRIDRRMWEQTTLSTLFFFVSWSCLDVIHFIYHVGFHVPNLVIRRMCAAMSPTAATVGDMLVSWLVRQSETFISDSCLLEITGHKPSCFLLLFLLPSRSSSVYCINENNSCLCLPSPWIQSWTRAMDLTLVWYASVSLLASCISLTPFIRFPRSQRPAPLDWRIWVIWTTKGLPDTGAPFANIAQLGAQMMTPKVFCLLNLQPKSCV